MRGRREQQRRRSLYENGLKAGDQLAAKAAVADAVPDVEALLLLPSDNEEEQPQRSVRRIVRLQSSQEGLSLLMMGEGET
jgi:alpha-D-ribose 1-methylphosphonate 5-triphosphate synthase subunit PhnH